MLARWLHASVEEKLGDFPAVALLGSRQVGKTTLAKHVAATRGDAIYLDLELPSDLARLTDPEAFLSRHATRLVVLDEVHRRPDLFPILRGLIDRDRRPGRFLILGSASPHLLRQSAETLAGRIALVELPPLSVLELLRQAEPAPGWQQLWDRGGYPDSLLARSDAASHEWRQSFLRTYLERDLPSLGIRVPATQLRRFWQMLAHWHGQLWNASAFARNFDVSAPTVRHYLDILADTFVVRQLQPLHANLKKRIVKSPKVYVRDSGLLHALLGIQDLDALYGHPQLGASFEGFAIEQILAVLPPSVDAAFFRTHVGDELDLVLTQGRRRSAVEIKLSSAPKLPDGMREAMAEVGASRGYVVVPEGEAFPLADNVEAMSLAEFVDGLTNWPS